MTRDEMDAVAAGLRTKAAKIRALDRCGVKRAEIARYLNIRYQHVRNVLVQPPPARGETLSEAPSPKASLALTLDEAKQGLARHFGVPAHAVEITIRG